MTLQLECLHDSLKFLDNRIDTLAQRLNGILRQDSLRGQNACGEEQKEEEHLVPVAQAIKDANNSVAKANSKLNGLINLIEL